MEMLQQIVSYLLLSVLISALLSIPVINLLYKLKIVRKIEVDFSTLIEDRKGKYGTPIMGGVLVILPVIIINILFNYSPAILLTTVIFFMAGLLGGIDDLLNIFGKTRKFRTIKRLLMLIRVHKDYKKRFLYFVTLPWFMFERFMHMFESNPGTGLRAHEKILVQIGLGVALGVYLQSIYGSFLWLPFINGIDLGFLYIPFVTFVFAAMTNAVNITDGMDGLSAGILFSAFCGFLVVSLIFGHIDNALLSATVIGSLLNYLYFNIAPARVQFGDTGSFSMGALLTVVGFMSGKGILLAIIGLPFVIEMLSVIVQSLTRRIFGRRIFTMAPLHHHFEMLGWKEEKVVMRFWILSIFATVIGVWLSFY